MMSDPHTYRFASTVAMERICSLLVSGRVPFDAPLSERAVAEAIGLGRMPAREALRALARDGIVSIEPGRGTFLRRIKAQEIVELLQVRLAIEGMAARLAAEQGFVGELPRIVVALQALRKQPLTAHNLGEAEAMGDQVHRSVVQGAENEILNSLYSGLRLRIGISLRLVQCRTPKRIRETIDEHLAVAKAILARTPDVAVDKLHSHLQRGHNVTIAYLKTSKIAPSGGTPAIAGLARRRGRPAAAAVD